MPEVPLYVLDNSVATKWYLREDYADQQALEIGRDYIAHRIILTAPHVLPYELAGVVRRYVSHGVLTEREGRAFYSRFISERVPYRDPEGIHSLAYDYVSRYSLQYFDSLYLALAVIEDAQVITYDRRFYDAMPEGRRLWLPDYESPVMNDN